jgi:hypothetical protein
MEEGGDNSNSKLRIKERLTRVRSPREEYFLDLCKELLLLREQIKEGQRAFNQSELLLEAITNRILQEELRELHQELQRSKNPS